MEEQKLHPLKDKWFVFYTRAVKSGESYDDGCTELDYVHSIEEVFATLNTLPNVCLLPQDDSIVFSRNKVAPKFESFPGGGRISVFTRTKTQGDDCVSKIVAAVLGEEVTQTVTSGVPVADLVRISHKPHRLYGDAARIEVWAKESPYLTQMETYFKDIFKMYPGITLKASEMK